MQITCLNIIPELNKIVDETNTSIVESMTNPDMRYEWVCIKPDVTYDFFYQNLKEGWEKIINDFINLPDKCSISRMSQLLGLYGEITPERVTEVHNFLESLFEDRRVSGISSVNIDNIILDVVANILMKPELSDFELHINFMDNMKNLALILLEYCQCQLGDIFKLFIRKYHKKYYKKFQGKTKDDVIDMIRADYNKMKKFLKGLQFGKDKKMETKMVDTLSMHLAGIYGFGIENELDKLIPKDLGSLKDFFITVVSKYFNNLHPIIWAQIFKNLTENVFIDLPFTPDEIFSFVSKYTLLNSGPFILKILQMIRPFLSPEMATKYNLTKLTYPLLKSYQINTMLGRVVYGWDMYKILQNYSASVGHVCKLVRVDNPTNIFIIKVIKPLAVAQSCWEYKILYDIFAEGTCEQSFIKNMLESNGREMNLDNEIKNIDEGYKNYTGDYQSIFGVDINAKLTTVQHIDGIIIPNIWFAMAMTLAPGIPLSRLVEEDLLEKDTKYRARLHRCLDLLVYHFFHSLVKTGFYHADMHAGNIFFSYEQKQMTIIDFGAVGHIDIYADDPNSRTLLNIFIMSIFYNYDEILDTMTILLNSKCPETQIDMTTPEYQKLKERLVEYKIGKIRNQDVERQNAENYKRDIFSKERINEEKASDTLPMETPFNPRNIDSIYTYLEHEPRGTETIVENRYELPEFTEILGETKSITFVGVLEQIIKFYALSGVNIAIKFSEFYEFQKAYALLLGVLYKTHYNSYRTSIAVRKAIINLGNIVELVHVGTVAHVIATYRNEQEKYNKLEEQVLGQEIQPQIVGDGLQPEKLILPIQDIRIQANKYILPIENLRSK